MGKVELGREISSLGLAVGVAMVDCAAVVLEDVVVLSVAKGRCESSVAFVGTAVGSVRVKGIWEASPALAP